MSDLKVLWQPASLRSFQYTTLFFQQTVGVDLLLGIFSRMVSTKKSLVRLQVVIWIFSFVLFYLRFKLPGWSVAYILGITVSSFIAYAVIIYGYFILYNKLFHRLRLFHFVLIVFFFFLFIVVLKVVVENEFVSKLTDQHFRLFYSDTDFIARDHFANALGSSFFVLIIGILFKSFIESLAIRERQAEIQKKHLEAELNQLKAQVQPHFLFNSLNNIYYDTYKVLPNAAARIAMLSDIMRYFMEESPKERVPISTELEFIEDYIKLEQIRFHFPINIEIDKSINNNLMIPPMLLIPLVENTFKHGLKNDSEASKIEIKLSYENEKFRFRTKNTLYKNSDANERTGTGLKNLRERLHLLYKNDFVLDLSQKNEHFIAELIIPAYEN